MADTKEALALRLSALASSLTLGSLALALVLVFAGDSTGTAARLPNYVAPTGVAVEQSVRAAGLRILPEEGQLTHVHSHLSIEVDGQQLKVPALVGIDEPAKHYSEIHTHDTSGILHVEAARKATFTLGQFLAEWRVPAGQSTLGPYTDGNGSTRLIVYVDGRQWRGDLRQIRLLNHGDIMISITTDGSTPIAAAPFTWPKGY